jgi:hypothetical protein
VLPTLKLELLKLLDSPKKLVLMLEFAEYLTLNMLELPLNKKLPELEKNSSINYTLLPMEPPMELPLISRPLLTINLSLDFHALTIKKLLLLLGNSIPPFKLLLGSELPLLSELPPLSLTLKPPLVFL